MTDSKSRETKPDVRKGVQTGVPLGKPKETAVDRRPAQRAVDRPQIERKG